MTTLIEPEFVPFIVILSLVVPFRTNGTFGDISNVVYAANPSENLCNELVAVAVGAAAVNGNQVEIVIVVAAVLCAHMQATSAYLLAGAEYTIDSVACRVYDASCFIIPYAIKFLCYPLPGACIR
jgi:hypothetical protein